MRIAALALVLPLAAAAQAPTPPAGQAAPQAPAGPPPARGAPVEAPPDSAPPYAGTVSGSVRQLNLARGTITVQAGQGTVTFNADPGQLAPLDAGDRVAFPYVSYDGALWLSPEATRGEIGQVPNEAQSRLTGTIRRIQRAQGTITVRGLTFRIHPSRLEGLVPGQLVTLTYAQVGQASWVAELQPLRRRARPTPPAEAAPGDANAPGASAPERPASPPDAGPETPPPQR